MLWESFPVRMMPFASRTPERTLPWLAVVPAAPLAPTALLHGSPGLREDGWLPVAAGDTPDISTWSVRITHGVAWLRRRGGEPQHTGDQPERWLELIRASGGLNLVYNPVGQFAMGLSALALSPFALCARVPLIHDAKRSTTA